MPGLFRRIERMMSRQLRRIVSLGLIGTALPSLAVPAGGLDQSGDPVHGELLYQRCMGCHSFERNRTGPRHCGLVGRTAGTVPGFTYSEAMRESKIVWTRKMLDRFLAAPTVMIPATTMGYAGIEDAKDRLDLIAYIERTGQSATVCGSDRESGRR